MKNLINNIIKSYSNEFKKYGDSPKAVMWPKGRQNLRFDALMQHVPKNKRFTILDFGCGLSHLIEYLTQNYGDFEYTGCDIVDDFLNHNRKKYNQHKFFNSIDNQVRKNYDYILVSGTFNILYSDDIDKNTKLVYDQIKLLFEKCNIAISINFMNDQVDYKSPNAYHQNVIEIYDFCCKNLSKRIIINQSYMPYEFTITIYKDQKIKSPENIYNFYE